jgi:2-succinyl-5-enolpyruvyl-6-hydroxy-3-cyclohexene-1-carboxylate synthase
MYSSNQLVKQLISLLKQFGITKVVVSPGGRHVQFILSLERDSDFELYSVVDERSAAFFALGLIQETGKPVAIACSSGTACMNYGSAITEAYYQHLPLLVLSADRLPHYLNQGEEQMYNQVEPFKTITKCQVQLPEVNNDLDLWLCNRRINEALLALTHRGKGPVQINYPMHTIYGNGFADTELPVARKISLNSLTSEVNFEGFSRKLLGKKIIVICGQSVLQSSEFTNSLSAFLKKYNAVLLTDYMSNCHVDGAIKNSLAIIHSMKQAEAQNYIPDVIITLGGNYIFNPELKQLLAQGTAEHWLVGPEGEVCDPFQTLTEIFEMEESLFFSNINKYPVDKIEPSFSKLWYELASTPEPSLDKYDEIYVIGKLIKSLPNNCDLQLANSNTIRMAQFFSIPPEVRVNCNRGVNGIDGSMSTAIGFSASTDRTVFYITGDLSFFYDMNSLWIKHISPKMRILLINNDGGGFMYHKLRIIDGKKSITLAAENEVNAKGWVESLGFKYISAHNSEEYNKALNILTDETIKVPVVVEAFTDLITDGNITSDYYRTLDRRSFSEKVQGRLSHIVNSVFDK